ncbi:MAG: hypothetical protein ACRDO7_04205 [Nocardioidaceae bacterium]
MNDSQHDPVGSLAEELSKLMGVVSGLSDTGSRARTDATEEDGSADDAPGHDHHIANGSASCQVCPVCQTIAFVRSTSPEVREHLTASAVALTTAARALVDALAAHQSQQRTGPTDDDTGTRDGGVENIDLSEDDSWD